MCKDSNTMWQRQNCELFTTMDLIAGQVLPSNRYLGAEIGDSGAEERRHETEGLENGGEILKPAAIMVDFGVEALRRAAPGGLAWIKTYARGINLLIVGPSGSGKSSFFDYLVYGLLRRQSDHITTSTENRSPTFSIPLGRNESLRLRVRKALDQPGQLAPITQATLIKEKRPHAVIVILDSTATIADLKNWIAEFCEHADRVFRESSALRRKIRSFIVCLNKRDKLNTRQQYSSRSVAVRRGLNDGLASTFGTSYVKGIPIMQCVSVQTSEYESSLIDDVIVAIAKQVRQHGTL